MPAYCRCPRSTATPRPAFQLAPQRRFRIVGALALCLRPCRAAASSASRQAVLCADGSRPATAPPQRPGQQSSVPAVPLPAAAPPRLCLSPGDPPRRPGQHKPHLAEKSTPVWLAIWCTWAGFANSQLWRATFRSNYSYKCPSALLLPWSRCSDRRKSVGPSAPIAYATSVSPPNEVAAWLCARVLGAG